MALQLTVPNMACSACSDTIIKAIEAIDPSATVQADPKTKQVNVETQASEASVKQAIATAGYQIETAMETVTATPAEDRAEEDLSQDLAQ
ncbi:heavy-metal-associated domain-containing protein [Leptolyngbya sp. AN02str]|jgi:copper chaperone|uniref:Heavy-metal-associated domain-containing protein n=1 Tax=Leptolyngbya sp. NK1-12 TaxID=2547451 RepID=A0AA96WZQ2_9CYAN|nr:heavy-metal-associated domain-containing protein [Leptolyngbya sp. NK1-12]WNZ28092.1 heavy-metal-associated domain-containing protein [Leptolyngbya sp. NK1-12]